jgi:hypothetical protein
MTSKSALIQISTALFSVISTIYFVAFAIYSFVLYVIHTSLSPTPDIVGNVFRLFPTSALIPLVLGLSAIVFAYSAVKVKTYSAYGRLFGITSLLIFIPASTLALHFGLSSLIPVPAYEFIISPVVMAGIINLFLLALSSRIAVLPNPPLGNKSKLLLILMAFIYLPCAIVAAVLYAQSLDQDFRYTQAKSVTQFHIYRPSPIPFGMTNARYYIPNTTFAGTTTAVATAFESPLTSLTSPEKSKILILKQTQVSTNYNLSEYLSTLNSFAPFTPVSPSMPALKVAYLSSKVTPSGHLVILTQDNILVHLSSAGLTQAELLDFAASLK